VLAALDHDEWLRVALPPGGLAAADADADRFVGSIGHAFWSI
jgi:hypothetical protein